MRWEKNFSTGKGGKSDESWENVMKLMDEATKLKCNELSSHKPNIKGLEGEENRKKAFHASLWRE